MTLHGYKCLIPTNPNFLIYLVILAHAWGRTQAHDLFFMLRDIPKYLKEQLIRVGVCHTYKDQDLGLKCFMNQELTRSKEMQAKFITLYLLEVSR